MSSAALAGALQYYQAGKMQAAEEVCRQVLKAEPDHAEALHLLGMISLQTGKHQLSVELISRALAVRPDWAEAHFDLGRTLKAQGDLDAASRCYRRVLQLRPDLAEAHNNLGNTLTVLGNLDEAVACYRRALSLHPQCADIHNNLGNALIEQGKFDQAVASCRQALDITPDFAAAHNNLGNAYHHLGNADAAVVCCRRALELKPDYVEAWYNLANACYAQGQINDAIACYRRALELNPGFADAHHNLGNSLRDQTKLTEAIACYRQALELKPVFAGAHNNLGNALQGQGQLTEAIACYRRALHLAPDFADAHNNLGNAVRDQGQPDDALVWYRKALELEPDSAVAHSNLLCTLHYCPSVTPAAMADAHAEYHRRHAAALCCGTAQREHPRGQAHRQLRVGFVSPDLWTHPVGYFLVRVLEHLHPDRLKTVCYSDRVVQDDLTLRLQKAATEWRDVAGLSDERLAELIRHDEIDILFDLAGHTGRNRLLVFARKPAPVQITWIGYEGTTGLEAMDYLLADRHVVPEGSEGYYRERVLRLPDGYLCYDPPGQAPPVAPLPALETGCVTFGCFNNLAKITPEVVTVWARILHQVPTARLVLKYRGLGDATVKQRYLELFSAHGVEPRRLDLQPWSSYADYLAAYQKIDLALDPFPFSGGTTTCEALWMGVPVITCPGATFASRHTLTHLSNVGLTETIARNLEDYVELAVSLAGDLSRLVRLRSGLRERVAASPLCDGERFAANFESLLHDLWIGGGTDTENATDRNRCDNRAAREALPPVGSQPVVGPGRRDHLDSSGVTIAQKGPAIEELLTAALSERRAGRLGVAQEICRRILADDVHHADVWDLSGVIAFELNQRAAAIEHLGRAIQLNGGRALYHDHLARVYRSLGRLPAARQCYCRILEIDPVNAAARDKQQQLLDHERMNESSGQGMCDVTETALNSWIIQARDIGMLQVDAEIRSLCDFLRDKSLGNVLEIGSHHGGTFFLWCRLATGKKISLDLPGGAFGGLGIDDIALRNDSMRSWADDVYTLSGNSHDSKPRQQIIDILQLEELDLLFIDGDHTYEGVRADYEMYSELVRPGGYIVLHDIVDSQTHRAQNCQVARFWNEIAGQKIEFNARGEWGGIGVVERPPRSNDVKFNFDRGNTLKQLGQLDNAVECYRRALAIQPDAPAIHNNLAVVRTSQGLLSDAIASYRRALELKPDFVLAHSNLLYTLNFCHDVEPAAIYEEHRRWNSLYAVPLAKSIEPHLNDRAPDRRLRVGYVSSDFSQRPVGLFILPLLAHHDRQHFEIFCYSSASQLDEITTACRALCHQWRDVTTNTDEEVAQIVRADQIDILVDLTMHMPGSRLLAFARKPAPIQVTYLAYCGTTGLDAMDYRLTDPRLDPVGTPRSYYSEESLFLPESYWCYPDRSDDPAVAPLPSARTGSVTFGCLNNFCKMSAPTQDVWIRLLRDLPDSRLLLHALPGAHRDDLRQRFAREGIAADRLEFIGYLPTCEYLQAYNRIDIALDTFPVGGGTTTCDALWMGVPVVTLAGDTALGRGGLSILSTLELTELVAHYRDVYVQIAVDLALDKPRLIALREGLRGRMRRSPLMNAPRFTGHLESAYRSVWQRWCGQS